MDLARSRGTGEAFWVGKPEGKCRGRKMKGLLKEESK